MNLDSLILKTAAVIFLMFLFSLAGAITFPTLSFITNSNGTGLTDLLLFIGIMLVLSIIGNLIGRGIKTIKKTLEALVIAFVGSFFMGATLIIFTVLNLPGSARLNLNWLGTSWYSSILTLFFIGAPLLLVFIVVE